MVQRQSDKIRFLTTAPDQQTGRTLGKLRATLSLWNAAVRPQNQNRETTARFDLLHEFCTIRKTPHE